MAYLPNFPVLRNFKPAEMNPFGAPRVVLYFCHSENGYAARRSTFNVWLFSVDATFSCLLISPKPTNSAS